MSKKVTLATCWLNGCSGCHMSFLDLDEAIIDILDQVELVYSPIIDIKEFPEMVDITLVEGSIGTDEDVEKIQHIRQHTHYLIAMGDCASTGNIPAMRNRYSVEQVIQHVYHNKANIDGTVPTVGVPTLLDKVRPVSAVVKIDLAIPGCPPTSANIAYVLTELLANRKPDLTARAHFG